jgi:hypothetical protein
MKMCDTGERFKSTFEDTPTTAVCALAEWDGDTNVQSVYYDCKNYMANIFRFKNKIFIRSMYLFDESILDQYFETPCDTWDATYENLPIVDTLIWKNNDGMVLDNDATAFEVFKQSEEELEVCWKDKRILFSPEKITLNNVEAVLDMTGSAAQIRADKRGLQYSYKEHSYRMDVENSDVLITDGKVYIKPNRTTELKLRKGF